MGFEELEVIGKKMLERFPVVKHTAKRVYQLASVAISNEKKRSEGNIQHVSPEDSYEYFYGYYDKSPWDITNRYLICNRVKRTNKSVAPTEPGTVCLIDTLENNKLIEIGITRSWNVQQGCMAQWIGPDYKSHIIYNDFRDGKYCSILYNAETLAEEKVFPFPIYDVSADGRVALSLDFSRLHRLRPGYGYSNLPDRTKNMLCPDECCIWKINIETGRLEELYKYTDFAAFEPDETMNGAEHKVNHIMISPNGKRFMVLHRWINKGKKHTRLVTANIDKTEMYNLSDDVFVSHCFWKNDTEILSFLRKKDSGDHYYLLKDKTHEYKMMWPELHTDGHCSYSPNREFIITDTYPNRKRIASVYLCTEEDDRSRCIARVFSPFKYDNDCRCDLHPRWSRDSKTICIDSVHEGKRGIYLISVNEAINSFRSKKSIYNQQSDKLISFIIPAYNSSKTIERCINSIIKQTNSKWEAIIINDGSTDNTLEILKKFENDQRIKIISQENGGPGNARNKGLMYATADFVSFLDADDYLDNNFVELIGDRIERTNADVVFYETIYEDEDGNIKKTSKIYRYANETKKDFIILQLSGVFSWGADKVVKNEIIRESGACFLGQEVGEEALFTFRILNQAQRIEFVKHPLYHYVQTNQGQHKKGKNDPLRAAVYSVKDFLVENGFIPYYQDALNNMAFKAVTMCLYRTALEDSFVKVRRKMRKSLNEYEADFDFQLVNSSKFSKSSKMLLHYVQNKKMLPIYVASRIRKRS